MFNKILAICISAMVAFFIYLLCEAKLSIGIASAFFFLSVFLLNSFFLIEDKLDKDETTADKLLDLFAVSGSLPTDEDISKKAQEARVNDINDSINRVGGFIVGATWMRDLLKGNDHIGESNEMV